MKQTKNIKGQGQHLARQLSAEEKCKLTIWMFQNKELCEKHTAHELAIIATDALGFVVSNSSAQTFKNATFPDLKRVRRSASAVAGSQMAIDMIMSLEKRVARIEKEFNLF